MIDQPEDSIGNPDLESTDIFDVLKKLQPDVGARVSFRKAVADELVHLKTNPRDGCRPRSEKTSTPVFPFMIGTCVGIAASFVFVSLMMNHRIPEVASPVPSSPITDDRLLQPDLTRDPKDDDSIKYDVRVTETYLCGIGKVNSVSRYVLREND